MGTSLTDCGGGTCGVSRTKGCNKLWMVAKQSFCKLTWRIDIVLRTSNVVEHAIRRIEARRVLKETTCHIGDAKNVLEITAQIYENGPVIAPWPVHHQRDRATCNLSARTVLAHHDRAFAPFLVFRNVVRQRYPPNYNFEPATEVAGFGRESGRTTNF
jgi:hypothetical protein